MLINVAEGHNQELSVIHPPVVLLSQASHPQHRLSIKRHSVLAASWKNYLEAQFVLMMQFYLRPDAWRATSDLCACVHGPVLSCLGAAFQRFANK